MSVPPERCQTPGAGCAGAAGNVRKDRWERPSEKDFTKTFAKTNATWRYIDNYTNTKIHQYTNIYLN